MRIYMPLALGVLFQMGCAGLTLSPTATPARLRVYNDEIASQYVTANNFEREGQFEEARQIYLGLHEKHPQNPDYLHRLAVVNTRLHRYDEAATYYERARLAEPKNVRMLADMGYSAYLKGDLTTSEEVLRDAIRIQPGNARVINNLALVLGARGKMDECQSLLDQLGDDTKKLTSLGYIYAKRGEMNLAEARYREALAINPNLTYAKEALAGILQQQIPDEDLTPLTQVSVVSNSPRSGWVDMDDRHVEQASGTLDGIPSAVMTAAFVQPSSKSKVPALLDDDEPATNPSETAVIQVAQFDEEEQEPDFTSQKVEQETEAPVVEDDDWAKD